MRQPRLKSPPSHPSGFYHCISRVVDRQFVFGEVEREKFVDLMRRYAIFCGVKVITYCILSNHFHLLIEVPQPSNQKIESDTLLNRCSAIYRPATVSRISRELKRFHDQPADLEKYVAQFTNRMCDISQFMKSLKQRFTQWYNASRPTRRKGTLWEERFKSLLVEARTETLAIVAAYIDLNPVRAKIVIDPKDYRWSGYGAAFGGQLEALHGLKSMFRSESEPMEMYRRFLFCKGIEPGNTHHCEGNRRGFTAEEVQQVWEAGGRVAIGEALRCRIRYLVDGVILGSQSYVHEVAQRYQALPRKYLRWNSRPTISFQNGILDDFVGFDRKQS